MIIQVFFFFFETEVCQYRNTNLNIELTHAYLTFYFLNFINSDTSGHSGMWHPLFPSNTDCLSLLLKVYSFPSFGYCYGEFLSTLLVKMCRAIYHEFSIKLNSDTTVNWWQLSGMNFLLVSRLFIQIQFTHSFGTLSRWGCSSIRLSNIIKISHTLN